MIVGILDYGVGNLGSVVQAIEELRVNPLLVERASDVGKADCLILPGVGNFSACKALLDREEWTNALKEEVEGNKKPLLGICLGMQLLADLGAEGEDSQDATPGLGFVPGKVLSLKDLGCTHTVPHMGWNEITVTNDNPLFRGIPNGTDFYFVHSFAFSAEDDSDVLATSNYGIPLVAGVGREHVWGVQFHPEKSSKAGRKVLSNFLATV